MYKGIFPTGDVKCDSINAADYATSYAAEAACDNVSGCYWSGLYCSDKSDTTKNKLKEYITVISESFTDTIMSSKYNNNITQFVNIECTPDETNRMSDTYNQCASGFSDDEDASTIASLCNYENQGSDVIQYCTAENISLTSNLDDNIISNISDDIKNDLETNITSDLNQAVDTASSNASASTDSDVSNNITSVVESVITIYNTIIDEVQANLSIGQGVNIIDAQSNSQMSLNQTQQIIFNVLSSNDAVVSATNDLTDSVTQAQISSLNTNILKIIIIIIFIIVAIILVIGFTLYIIKVVRK